MLSYTPTVLFMALIPGYFGFTGIAGEATGIAQFLFYIFLGAFIISVVAGRRKRAD